MPEVIGVIDRSADVSQFVISDIEQDDAWVSMPEAETIELEAWD